MFKDLRGYVKKGFRQAKNAVGGIIHSDDTTEFDERVVRWEGQIEGLKKLKDSLEIFVEALSTVGAAGAVLGEALNQHFVNQTKDTKEPNPALSQFIGISLLFDKINSDLNNTIQTAFRATITNRCLKPLNAVLSKTPEMIKKLETRKTIMIDREVYRVKCEKDAATKNAKDSEVARHKQKHQACTEELQKVESEVLDAFDQFDEAMPDLFGNEIAAMVASLYYYSSSSAVLLGQLLPFLPQSQSTLCLLSMSTATSKFLQSPAVRQDLESGASSAVVNPTYERSDIYGGGIGEYGVKAPPVSEDVPLQTEPYPAPHIPSRHLTNMSHLGSGVSGATSQIGEDFISPLHANMAPSISPVNTTIKNLPGYKNTGKTLTADLDLINSSNTTAAATATALQPLATTGSSGSLPLGAIHNSVSVQNVHVESAVTTARDEHNLAGGPAQTITSQEQLNQAFATQANIKPVSDTAHSSSGHEPVHPSGHSSVHANPPAGSPNAHHSAPHQHHPIINFPPPPSSSHPISSARSAHTAMTSDSIPAAQPHAHPHSGAGTAAGRPGSDSGLPPLSPAIKPTKPIKASAKWSSSQSAADGK